MLANLSHVEPIYFVIASAILTCSTLFFASLFFSYKKLLTYSEQSNRAKSFFIERISYELKNGLNSVIGFSQMLHSEFFGPVNHKQKDRINDIIISGSNMESLVNDFLDLAKGKTGKITLIESQFKLQELVDKVVDQLKLKIKANKIHLIIHLTHPDILITADRVKYAQILKNLIDNAIKFSNKDAQVTITDKLRKNQGLELSVSDSGKGMSVDELVEAFDFPDHEREISRPYGVGLGLPLVKLLASLHGGKVNINSEPNVGTTVSFIIPTYRIDGVK